MNAKVLNVLILILIFFVIACKSKQQVSKAVIIERKSNQDSFLTITYTYEVKGKLYTDSIKLKNKIISSDTVSLVYLEENPQKHSLQLP